MKIKEGKGDGIFLAVNYTFLFLLTICILYPLIFILSSSFSSPSAVTAGRVRLLPVDPGIEGYKIVLSSQKIGRGYLNTVLYTVVGTTINVTLTILAGYALSKHNLVGKRFFTLMFTFTMLFSGGLMPTYLLIRQMNMLDTFWVMVIPNAMAVYQMIVARTYFVTTIPRDLYETCQIEGCSDFRFLASIVVPLSKTLIAVLVLLYAVGHWNSYFHAMIYLKDSSRFPLQIILREILLQNTIDYSDMNSIENSMRQDDVYELIKYVLIVVSSAPVLALYPFVQKYFVKGIMVGSIKG